MVPKDSSEELPDGWTVQFNVLKTGRKIKYYTNTGNGKKFYSKDDFISHIKAQSTRLDQPQPTKSSIGGPTNNNLMFMEHTNEHPEWLPHGWIVELRTRQSGYASGKIYKCYVDSSTGHKFYSKPEVLRYLESMKQKSCTLEQQETPMSVLPENKVQFEKSSVEDLPTGWIKSTKITRNANGVRKDPYYTDPVTGRVFRSKRDVQRYLETGEISRRAVFPKKGPIDEKILPSLSEAKRQKLKHDATGQQLYTGKGTSDVGSTSSTVTTVCVVTTVDVPSQESPRDNVEGNGAECKENFNANWLAQGNVEVSERNQDKNVSPAGRHGLLFPEYDNKQEQNLPDSETGSYKQKTQNSLSNFNNQKSLHLQRRFSKRLAGIEPELMGISSSIVQAIPEAGNKKEQEQNPPESGIKVDEIYGGKTLNSLSESNNKKGLNLPHQSSSCRDVIETKPGVNLVSIVQALPKTIKAQKGEAIIHMDLTSDVVTDKRSDQMNAEPITELPPWATTNANNPLLQELSNKSQKSDTTQSVLPKARVPNRNQCIVSADSGPILTSETTVQQEQNSLRGGMKRKGQEKTHNTLSKPSDKKLRKGLNVPCRSSKRIAGLEPEVEANTGSNAQALQNAKRSYKTEAILAVSLTSDKASRQLGAESGTEFPNHALTDVKNQVSFQDTAVSRNQLPVQETDKTNNENAEPQLIPPFGEFWSDPCLEFAFKTLTGEIPIEITAKSEMVSTPAADIIDQRNALMKTIDNSSKGKTQINPGRHKKSKSLLLPHQSPEQVPELGSELTGSSISNAHAFKMTGRTARKTSSRVEPVLDLGSPDNFVAGASQQLKAGPEVAHARYSTTQIEPSNKRVERLDDCTPTEKRSQKLQIEKNGNKPELQPNFSFGDYWSDPCFEFAFKTLTGAIPVDDNLPVQSYFQQQVDTSQIQREGYFQQQVDTSQTLREGYFQQPVDTSQTLREGYFQQPVDTSQTLRDGSLALPDCGLPSFFQTDISVHFDAPEKQAASQTRVPLNNPSFLPSGSVSLPSCSNIGSQQPTHLKENKGMQGKVNS
ncbi:uncharacterized protein LOC110609552 isoform X2 [Manihot esculenta]|uniref:Uncharacterized protein n=1 Tax=Manihot esculenta TaxID=3983 RepID=A0ACB7I5D3_MANES|nr:uncharacterized protein LOC110609552 isoform X2 [Manihot esculenta]KAG8659243.1 hypothetical protein MANES_02G024900v8 [Manihot esculenta]